MQRARLNLPTVILASMVMLSLPRVLAALPSGGAIDPCSGEHWGGREVIVDATSSEVSSNIFVQVDSHFTGVVYTNFGRFPTGQQNGECTNLLLLNFVSSTSGKQEGSIAGDGLTVFLDRTYYITIGNQLYTILNCNLWDKFGNQLQPYEDHMCDVPPTISSSGNGDRYVDMYIDVSGFGQKVIPFAQGGAGKPWILPIQQNGIYAYQDSYVINRYEVCEDIPGLNGSETEECAEDFVKLDYYFRRGYFPPHHAGQELHFIQWQYINSP